MRAATAILTLLLLSPLAFGRDVEIRADGGGFAVTGGTYRAAVGADGCLTQIQVGEASFLAPGVSVSRGAYFYAGGVVALPSVRKTGSRSIAGVGDLAAVKYEFDADGMTWTLANRSKTQIAFFVVLSVEVVGIAADGGEIERPPVVRKASVATYYTTTAKLEIRGCDRLWGDFAGGHLVWQVSLPPEARREVRVAAGLITEEEAAAVAPLAGPPLDADLVLLSPLDWQVFQRSSKSEGEILVSGRVKPDADRVEFRMGGEWTPLTIQAATRSFFARVPSPAGGWYEVEVRAMAGETEVARATIPHVGVGEVFVGAGQSNSTNCGAEKLVPASGLVSTFDGRGWREAKDPQPGVHDKSAGGSFWPAFGDAMVERYHVPIGVAVTGHGGTSVSAWAPDTELYRFFLDRVRRLGPGGFRAVLWHQGESDASRPGDDYFRRLAEVIRTSKRDAGWEFPWFVATATYLNPKRPRAEAIRAAQARLAEEGIALAGPDTDALDGEFRDRDGKGVHFSGKGLRAHGRLWAERVSDWLDGVLGR